MSFRGDCKYLDEETGTLYYAEYRPAQDGVDVAADTKTKSGKIMRLKVFISMEEIHAAEYSSVPEGLKKNDPIAAGLRIGFTKLMPQVKAKLDEIGDIDMMQSDRFKDDAIDQAIAREKKEREEAAATKAKQAKDEEDELSKNNDAWGMF